MNLSQLFREIVTGKENASPAEAAKSLGSAIGAFSQVAGTQTEELLRSVIAPWMFAVLSAAPRRWIPVLSSSRICAVDGGCASAAVAACALCGRPVCLRHCSVAMTAEVVCFDCHKVAGAHVPRWKPPSEAEAASDSISTDEAYDELGVDPMADDVDVKRAYRQACAEVHPDKVQGDEASKKRAAARFRRVQQAYAKIQQERAA